MQFIPQDRDTLGRETAKLSWNSHPACVEDAAESIEGFWKLARWARRRGGVQPTYTPTLYMIEAYSLLPLAHIGGRRGRSCERDIHLLMEQVHASWRAGPLVATLLTLDFSGAFDNAAHSRLIHNFRK